MIGNSIRFLVLALLTCLGISAGGCTHRQESTNKVGYYGFLKDDVKTWDPANAYDNVSLDLIPSVIETLYQYSYSSEVYQLEPLLAAELPRVSADHLTMEIPIRKGIYYQDDPCFKESGGKGRELRAQDFINGLKRLALPSLQSQGWWILDGKLVGINAFHERLSAAPKEEIKRLFAEPVEGMRALDDYRLQFQFKTPHPQFFYALAMSFSSPVPKEAMIAYGDEQGNLLDHPIGTGPFLLKRWERNHEIVLERNPKFRSESRGENPSLDRIVMNVMKESQPRWLNFRKGKVDSIELPKDNFQQAMTQEGKLSPELVDQGVHLSVGAGTTIRFLAFNMKDEWVGSSQRSHQFLRQALSASIDRQKWISLFTNGTGKPMVSAVPYGILERPATQKIKYDFNLALAQELLKKAGFPGGAGLPPIKLDLNDASTTGRQFGEFITQQFAQIGVQTEVIANTSPAYLEKIKQGNYQICQAGWIMDYPDAENIYQLLYGPNQAPGPGVANYSNHQFDDYYHQMAGLSHGPKRAGLVQKMDDLIQEDCPWVMGYYELSYALAQPWLTNFRNNGMILNKYKYYRIDRNLRKRRLEIK